MGRDVVFTHEVIRASLRVVPPLPPRLWLTDPVRPLDACGPISDGRIGSLVAFVLFAMRPSVQRYGDSPVDIAADGPRRKVFDHIERVLQYVRTPVRACVQPRCQPITESGQIQEKVLG